jgi:hypothetical protein
MNKKDQMKVLAREARKLVKDKAPAIVDEQILNHLFDELAEFTTDIMGKLTNLAAEDREGSEMAFGIIHDGLLTEISNQIKKLPTKLSAK